MKLYTLLFATSRYLLIILFIYTGCSKLIGYYLFLDQLANIPVLQKFAGFLSLFIPLAELLAAILLVFPKTEITGWWISGILLSSFTIYISAMLLFAPQLPCSCGGIISSLNWKQHFVINIALAIIALFKLYQHYFISKFSMHTRE